MGGNNSKVPFHINNDPFTSSNIPTNTEFKDYYYFNTNHDYVWGEASSCSETRSLEMATLDKLLFTHESKIPKPDFLTLDTQGSEYEILQGAQNALNSSVLAVHCEVEFCPLYKEQKLFSDIFNLLNSQHFQFIEFTRLGNLSPFRGAVNIRGRSFTAFGDALFFKNFSQLKESIEDPTELYVAAHKLCLIATIYGQVEFAVDILNQVNSLSWDDKATAEFRKQKFFIFLDKLYKEVSKSDTFYPKSFAESTNLSRKKTGPSSSSAPPLTFRKQIKNSLKKYPLILNSIRYLLNFPKKTKHFFLRLTRFWFLPFSPVEKIFIEHGLLKIAKIIRKNRSNQQIFASRKLKP
jgi:FkbM family methyltransferase